MGKIAIKSGVRALVPLPCFDIHFLALYLCQAQPGLCGVGILGQICQSIGDGVEEKKIHGFVDVVFSHFISNQKVILINNI